MIAFLLRYPIVVALVGGMFLGAGLDGAVHAFLRSRAELAAAQAQVKQAKKTVDFTVKSAAVSSEVGRKVEAEKVRIEWRTRTLIKEVPVYVTAETDRRFPVPVGFVRLHDAAAAGTPLPSPAPGTDDSPSAVAISAVAATVVDNYGAYQACRTEVIGWQSWYDQQAALWKRK